MLIWPDIFGLRPAFKEMARRLAESGYAVLVVNPFYRVKLARRPPLEHAELPGPGDARHAAGIDECIDSGDRSDGRQGIRRLVYFTQPAVDKKKKMGTTGYCMGGPFTLRTAATAPGRVGAGASFHGGGLVTDKPDSPHLLIPEIKAQYLFAIADNDDQKQPDAKTVLKDAFAKAKLPAEIEVYTGAQHGWCPPDSAVYNHDLAEKAWSRLLVLFKTALV